jgi:translation initiation factor IF-2
VSSGGRRVIVGEPRSSVAPAQDAGRRSATQSGTERTRDGAYAVRRGTPAEADRGATVPEEQRRSLGIAGVPSSREDTRDDPNVRRAVPRNVPGSRPPTPSAPVFWNDGHATPSATDRPAYAGMAVPRESRDAAGSSTDSRPSGGFERRGPGTERPQGPPPGGAGPTAQPREYRSTPSPPPASGGGDHRGPGPAAGQGAPPAPATTGDGGHQRGGGQSTGRAVPRGGR